MSRLARHLSAAAAVAVGLVVLSTASGAAGATPTESATSAVAANAAASDLAAVVVSPSNTENIYTSVTPCRIVDTRLGGGKIAAGAQRNFKVTGTSGFPAQGGLSGGCGIPNGATAVLASVKSINSTAVGYLRAWPYGGTEPTATTLTYPALAIGDGVALPLSVSGLTQLSVKAFGAATDLTIDVVGYYAPQIHARVTSGGVLDWTTSRILSSSRLQTGIFQVNVDRNVTGCSAIASVHGGSPVFTSTALTGSSVIVYLWLANGTAVDAYFYVTVLC